MKRKIKNIPLKIKAVGDLDEETQSGQFEAYASVFDVVDSYNEVVRKGAFAEDLKVWAKSDAPIPVLWGHDLFDMFNNIGHIEEASEDDHGLRVKGQLDTSTPQGAQAYKLIKSKRVTDLSFAYDVIESGETEEDGNKVVELKKLKIYEISIVPIGANPATEFLAVKSRLKDLVDRKKDDDGEIDLAASLRATRDVLDEMIKALEGGDDNEKDGDDPDEPEDDDTDESDDEGDGGEGDSKSDERPTYRERLLELIEI